jgi:hypothetical protein
VPREVAARDRATGEVEDLRAELAQLRGQPDTARRKADDARVEVEQSDRARVRAEATSDTRREVLDSLRDNNRDAGPASQS